MGAKEDARGLIETCIRAAEYLGRQDLVIKGHAIIATYEHEGPTYTFGEAFSDMYKRTRE